MGKVNTNKSKKKEVCGGSTAAQLTLKKRKNEGTLLANRDVNAKKSKKVGKKEWDKEDEIRLLQGMIEYKKLLGKNPFDDFKKTYRFIKEYIIYKPDSQDFVDKMRNFKNKLMDQRRIKAKVLSSSKAYKQTSSKLVTLLRGNDDVGPSTVEKQKRSKEIAKVEKRSKKP
ncbi:probable transcription factor At4g00232 [Capsella rubella]|uniref:probable transcription factor At4g00232 n=1 Tax=Capsella rubella TaxID=81985 RepID=UPI000CD4A86E|nr:probable transcription factor At4g00232 [Capsella rubella]